uniref:uncharacterized protein LOC128930070 isoform X4 n=1 Tax=Callithrix jacchus TaxID=9483 RepID=UPI0023DD56FA|nr:uncharacterized protein LOC128930070 isoform X4 [Callithrix jacchus]
MYKNPRRQPRQYHSGHRHGQRFYDKDAKSNGNCLVESPAIFPPGFLPPPSPQASCCPEKSPPSLLCSAQQQQAANHRSRKARQASAYPELTRNPLSHLSSLPRDGQPILSSYDTPPALCPRPVHPPIKPSYPSCAGAAIPDLLPFLACPLVPIKLNSASNSRAVIWGRVPGRGLQGGRTYGAETRDGGSLAPLATPSLQRPPQPSSNSASALRTRLD